MIVALDRLNVSIGVWVPVLIVDDDEVIQREHLILKRINDDHNNSKHPYRITRRFGCVNNMIKGNKTVEAISLMYTMKN